MMVGLYLYSVVVGLLLHLLIATTQLSELEGASTDAQSPSATLLSFFLSLLSQGVLKRVIRQELLAARVANFLGKLSTEVMMIMVMVGVVMLTMVGVVMMVSSLVLK